MRDKATTTASTAPAASNAAVEPHGDPRREQAQQLARAARTWNERHAELASQFRELTGIDSQDFRAVRAWQREHGLPGDGKIGAKTIEAAKDRDAGEPTAKADAGAGSQKADVAFTDAEAGDVDDSSVPAGDLAEEAIAGGETTNEEKRQAKTEEEKTEGSTLVQEGVEATAEDIGGDKGGLAAKAMLVPRLVELLRAHKWKEAVQYVVNAVGGEERMELVKLAAEKLAGELSEHAITWLERAVIAGGVYDVLMLGWEWTYGGIKAVQEAHEEGDRDSRIGIYAYAWADVLLTGQHDGAGAVDEEERKAMELGVRDGLATREQSPELAELLIVQYGGEDNARHALEDALFKRAGIDGVKTHG